MENTLKDPNPFDFSNQEKASINILYAEDEKPMQIIIFKILKRMGFAVTLANNGIQALSLFKEGSFSIVLTDFDMPFMDGLVLAARIKKISPGIPIIMLTGCDNEDDIEKLEAEKKLFYSILFKPFKIYELKNSIEGALAY